MAATPTTHPAAPVPWTRGNRLVGYDPDLRRVWIAGQRLHHGATGLAVAGASIALGLISDRRRALIALAGGALMAHDWKDRAIWFERGPQDQPPPVRSEGLGVPRLQHGDL